MATMTQDGFEAAERHLQRLEHRYRRAQSALAAAQALHHALRAAPGAKSTQVANAERSVHEAQRYLADLQRAIDRAEEASAAA